MSIKTKQQETVKVFSLFEDWIDKYEHLISLGKTLEPLKPEDRITPYIIKGCQSKVWLVPEYRDGKMHFYADSDAILTKGIVSMLVHVFSDETPDDIINAEVSFIDDIQLKEHLSPTRANGLVSMIKQIKFYAVAYKAKYTN